MAGGGRGSGEHGCRPRRQECLLLHRHVADGFVGSAQKLRCRFCADGCTGGLWFCWGARAAIDPNEGHFRSVDGAVDAAIN